MDGNFKKIWRKEKLLFFDLAEGALPPLLGTTEFEGIRDSLG